MISVNEARRILSENIQRAEKGSVLLKDCLDLILAESIYSPIDVPSFNNSAMDGYAMAFDEHTNGWDLSGVIAAGDTSARKIENGKAARIFTGAKIPEGADTVIPQELIKREKERISFSGDKIEAGSNVRLKGSQCKKGALILEKGTQIPPRGKRITGICWNSRSAGLKLPSVAYVITGNEFKEVGCR